MKFNSIHALFMNNATIFRYFSIDSKINYMHKLDHARIGLFLGRGGLSIGSITCT